MERGYTSPYWLTFNQARELGACVRKGETGTTVVYANAFEKTTTDADTGEETTERVPFLKAHTAFNAEPVDGLPARYAASPAVETEPAERLAAADASSPTPGPTPGTAAGWRTTGRARTTSSFPRISGSAGGRATTPPAPTSRSIMPRPGLCHVSSHFLATGSLLADPMRHDPDTG